MASSTLYPAKASSVPSSAKLRSPLLLFVLCLFLVFTPTVRPYIRNQMSLSVDGGSSDQLPSKADPKQVDQKAPRQDSYPKPPVAAPASDSADELVLRSNLSNSQLPRRGINEDPRGASRGPGNVPGGEMPLPPAIDANDSFVEKAHAYLTPAPFANRETPSTSNNGPPHSASASAAVTSGVSAAPVRGAAHNAGPTEEDDQELRTTNDQNRPGNHSLATNNVADLNQNLSRSDSSDPDGDAPKDDSEPDFETSSATPSSPSSASTSQKLPRCPHAILFSAPRHGSTWFINSLERCRYSQKDENGAERYNRYVNRNSELWVPAQPGPVLNISARGAAQYVKKNNSIKIFPMAVIQYLDGVRTLLAEAKRMNLPVIVLTRQMSDAYGSLQAAKDSGIWNRNAPKAASPLNRLQQLEQQQKRLETESSPEFDKFRDRLDRFFTQARRLLEEVGIANYDELDYDTIREMRLIRAEKNGCYIANCNFLT